MKIHVLLLSCIETLFKSVFCDVAHDVLYKITIQIKKLCQENWSKHFLYARSETSDVLWYGVCPSVCLSVRLSVCLSVRHIMSAQYLKMFLSDSHGTW